MTKLVFPLNGCSINNLSRKQVENLDIVNSVFLDQLFNTPVKINLNKSILLLKDYKFSNISNSSSKLHSLISVSGHTRITTLEYYNKAVELNPSIIISPFADSTKNSSKALKRNITYMNEIIAVKSTTDPMLFVAVDGGEKTIDRKISMETTVSLFNDHVDGYMFPFINQCNDFETMLKTSLEYLPANKMTMVYGLQKLEDLKKCIQLNIDYIDCGGLLSELDHVALLDEGSLNFKDDFTLDLAPIDEDCSCYGCVNHTRAYIHHLNKVDDLLGLTLLKLHNISFLNKLC